MNNFEIFVAFFILGSIITWIFLELRHDKPQCENGNGFGDGRNGDFK